MLRKPLARTASVLLLGILLLTAQLGAVTHAVWHAAAHPGGGEVAGSAVEHDHSAPDDSDITKLCTFDAAFGQVLGGASSSRPSLPPASAAREISRAINRSVAALDKPAPHSRGPPALL